MAQEEFLGMGREAKREAVMAIEAETRSPQGKRGREVHEEDC